MIFALAGNQNCGKTTLFNQLTGSNQHVGNFPGVTVDQKSGPVRGQKDCTVVDLTGIGLDDALSMISEGSPLIVKNSEGTWCVAEGYSDNHIEIADSKDGTVVKYERDSAVNGIASSGNIIYSYYK